MTFAPIVPPNLASLFQSPTEEVFMSAVNQALPLIDQDFQATIASWKNGPEFVIEAAHYEGGDIVGSVSTADEIYGYVVRGTSAHDIMPVKAKKLHFLSGYAPKTYKRVIGSQAGGASGADVFANVVHHPGSEARDFDLAIVEKRQPDFEAIVTTALNQAVSKVS